MRTLKHAVTTAICSALILGIAGSASAQAKKPNILVIWGDDIGITNISAYSRGLMALLLALLTAVFSMAA